MRGLCLLMILLAASGCTGMKCTLAVNGCMDHLYGDVQYFGVYDAPETREALEGLGYNITYYTGGQVEGTRGSLSLWTSALSDGPGPVNISVSPYLDIPDEVSHGKEHREARTQELHRIHTPMIEAALGELANRTRWNRTSEGIYWTV